MKFDQRLRCLLRTPGLPTSRVVGASAYKVVNRKREHVPYAPLALYFGATRRCNLDCVMCGTKLLKRVPDLSYERFRQILDQVPAHSMRGCQIGGTGEPLLNPDLIKMFTYAKNKGFITHLTTNATLLTEAKALPILRALDIIAISVDGATKETYEKIRRGGKFEDVIRNTQRLTALKKKIRAPTHIRINFVCSMLNIREIPEMVVLASQLGVDGLEIRMLREAFQWRPKPKYKQTIDDLSVSFSSVKKHIPPKSKIELSVETPRPTFPICDWPFKTCYITEDGFVTPCCNVPEPGISFGNVFNTPLAEIWNNQLYREFRRGFITGNPPESCVDCHTIG